MKKNNFNVNTTEQQDMRANEIIRIQKKRNNFVMLDKGFIEDTRLSWKAKGILVYLLSKPDQWKVIIGDIVKHSKDGARAVYAGLRELKHCGYYRKYPVREGQRIVRWESVVYECPQDYQEELKETKNNNKKEQKIIEESPNSLFCGFVHVENEDVDFVHIQNGDRNNININKNDLNQDRVSIYQKDEDKKEINDTDMIDTHQSENVSNESIPDYSSDALLEILKSDNIPEIVSNNICLDELQNEYPEKENKVNELYQTICEVLTNNTSPTIRISKQNIPVATVKREFCHLKKRHILYVLECIEKNQHKINGNIKNYILTSLFNSVRTVNYYKSYSESVFKDKPQTKSKWEIMVENKMRRDMGYDDNIDFSEN